MGARLYHSRWFGRGQHHNPRAYGLRAKDEPAIDWIVSVPVPHLFGEFRERLAAYVAKALHLCRSHFKDYREGGGLFGRNKGLYWWDATVRGSVKAGVIAKDYAIKPPKSE